MLFLKKIAVNLFNLLSNFLEFSVNNKKFYKFFKSRRLIMNFFPFPQKTHSLETFYRMCIEVSGVEETSSESDVVRAFRPWIH